MTWFSFVKKSSSFVHRGNSRSFICRVCGVNSSGASSLSQKGSSTFPSIYKNFSSKNTPFRHYVATSQSEPISDQVEMNYKEDTIFALSSGGGGSTATAVAVIRITGPESHEVLKVLMSKNQSAYKNVKLPKARYASLRMLYDPTMEIENDDGQRMDGERVRDPLDSSLVLLFNSPASFTGQDMVEIHTHGSRAVVQGVLSVLNKLSDDPFNINIRPAEKGEFTQRAYSSGKLGLLEVEALADLIVADTSKQRLQALRQLDGRLSKLYEGWRKELVKGLAHAEAVIDFGDDEDLEGDSGGEMNVWGNIKPRMEELRTKMLRHLADSQRGEILRDGVKIAICGPPNAGKSSLLNLIAAREAAIVSPIAGTTRDVVEVTIDLGGVRCILSDTAGVRKEGTTSDIIEVEGIKRAKMAAADAHVVICMVDANDDASDGIEIINDAIDESKNQIVLFLQNKIDLMNDNENANDVPTLLGTWAHKVDSFEISCEKNIGIETFIDSLTNKVRSRVENGDSGEDSVADEGAIITRARHRRHALAACNALTRFIERSDEGYMALDLAAEELRCASSDLGRITGAVDVEDVLDVLFSDFCIGK